MVQVKLSLELLVGLKLLVSICLVQVRETSFKFPIEP